MYFAGGGFPVDGSDVSWFAWWLLLRNERPTKEERAWVQRVHLLSGSSFSDLSKLARILVKDYRKLMLGLIDCGLHNFPVCHWCL